MKFLLYLSVWLVIVSLGVWSACAMRDAEERLREEEQYIPWRALVAKPSLLNRIFDWFNETADKIVAKRGL